MRKILPILFAFIFAIFLLASARVANAQVTPTPVVQLKDGAVPPGSWVIDPEVTFIGKNAARSGNLLDFILQNYNWVCVKQVPGTTQCDNSGNPLKAVWNTTVIFIIAPLLLIVILTASVIIIATRGRSLTITRFFPRFIAVLLLIAISFSLLQFFYQFVDGIQGFFLRREIILTGTPFGGNPCPPDCISQKDLLYVGWDYRNFIGLRLLGDQNSESAFISLLLTKLTALTYYVMVGILIIRKIILWLFIIVSPIFPILLLFYPIRNTGKIWIGEFFRWLLYAPLFAIFLNGLVALWRNQIPLVFSNPDIGNASKIIYPTAVNILLGGPKQFVTPTNSVNLTETFGLYVVSLLMLWGVIILPWILLQIFLDYAQNLGVGDSAIMKTLVNKINTLQPPPTSPAHPAGGGTAISLPFAKKFNLPIPPSAPTGLAREIPISTNNITQASYMPSAQVKAQTLSMVNMSLPSMRDIAKYDTSLISKDKDRQKETTIIRENLEKIGNPAIATNTTERERFTQIRESLVKESASGNTLATSIINAANIATKRSTRESISQIKNVLSQIANPASASTSASSSSSALGSSSVINREKLTKMNDSLVKAKKEGNTLAASILSVSSKTSDLEIEKLQERIMDAKVKGEPIATQIAQITQQKTAIPVANRVQTVSAEDYEAVKDMWKENYKNLEVPEGMLGTRSEWIKADMTKIEEIIQLLSAKDEEQVNKGMEEVSGILPFLLVGGFSQAEILSYLKAKLEAAKDVAAEIVQDEEDKVTVSVKKTAQATQTMTASISEDSGDDESSVSGLNAGSGSISQQATNEILSLVNIKLPKISDIARYEALALSKDKSEAAEVDAMHKALQNIASPTSITNATEREHFEKLRDKLIEESKNGSLIAQAVLTAAEGARAAGSVSTSTTARELLSQIANPSLSSTTGNKERFNKLNDQLTKASREGNTLAASLLSVKETATKEEIDRLTAQLNEENKKGNTLAASVLENIKAPVSLPSTNRIQNVSKEDYIAVKDLWKQNYQNLDVPQELAGSRADWIKDDISKIDNIVSMLSSSNPEQQRKGMDEVSSILPFLLVGGFSSSEIISYLQAKQEAAKELLTNISQEEETKVTIARKTTSFENTQAIAREEALPVDSDLSTKSLVGKKIDVSQLSDELMKLASIQLPNLKDIVAYEVKDLTKDKTESERILQINQVLERISNPVNIASVSERKKYEELRGKLAEESMSGNVTAGVILAAVSQLNRSVGQIDATLSDVKQVLLQIVNSGTISAADDRDYYTRLHEYLEKESREKNNALASKILKVNETTGTKEIEEIREQLVKEGNSVLPQLTTAVNDYSNASQLRTVIKQIVIPEQAVSASDRANFVKLHDLASKESQKGNSLATTLLSVNEKTSDASLKQLHDKLVEAGKAGDPVASSVLSLASTPSSFASANRLQEVTPEEYEEVRNLWQKAYKQYLVPQGFTEDEKGRTEWISKDAADIEETINMLNSADQETKNKGIEKVSSILPFLLLGGYSFNEINNYLKIKLEAAKYALSDLQQEEDTQVTVGVKKNIVTKQSMSAAIPQDSGVSRGEDDSKQAASQSISLHPVSNEILSAVDIKLPTMSDIARYEYLSLSRDKSKTVEVEKIHDNLKKVIDPASITVLPEREKYQKLQERLIGESQKQNAVAVSVLNAATSVYQNTLNASSDQIKNVFSKIVNPALADSEGERKRLEELRNMLDKDARTNNNKLAASILSVNEKTTVPEMEKIREDLRRGQIEGNRLANTIVWTINKSILGVRSAEQVKKVFMQIANPVLVSDPIGRNKFARAHDILLKASLSGNHMANTILSVNEKTTEVEVDKMFGAIKVAREQNDPLSAGILALVNFTFPVSLPPVNQVQKVGKEDYDNVKQIWKENYSHNDMPQGIVANRADWIKEDIANIDIITNQLSSPDKELIEKGMEEVSNILPFVLVGGFTQEEVVSYLKTKQEAGKEALELLAKDEENKIEVLPEKNEAPKEMSANKIEDQDAASASAVKEEKK